MNSSPLRQTVLEYLHDHNVMTLATHGPQGLWAAAVYYVNDGFTLYFLSLPESRHSQNLAANPAVSAAIQEDYGDWRKIKGIQLEGEASKVLGVEQSSAMARYGLKFPVVGTLAQAPAEIADAFRRVAWFKVMPSRLFFIDNSSGFGHRDEVRL